MFGKRLNPITQEIEFHNGIDIALPEGTPLVAVQDGIVLGIWESVSYGLVLRYETIEGLLVMYAHLESVCVLEGEAVLKGDIVAYSGNSGYSTNPHLHYTIFEEGEEIDPFVFVELDKI